MKNSSDSGTFVTVLLFVVTFASWALMIFILGTNLAKLISAESYWDLTEISHSTYLEPEVVLVSIILWLPANVFLAFICYLRLPSEAEIGLKKMLTTSRKNKCLIGTLILVLIISVGFNLYDHLITFPQMQATENNMRTEAFKAWLSKMTLIKNLLSRAKTNYDIRDCGTHASWAKLYVDLFESGIDISESEKELYYGVSKATHYLQEALDRIYFGNETGPVVGRNLDQYDLTIIGNLIETIEDLRSTTISLSLNGIEPTQQLKDDGVLTDVLRYLEQVYEFAQAVHEYYGIL